MGFQTGTCASIHTLFMVLHDSRKRVFVWGGWAVHMSSIGVPLPSAGWFPVQRQLALLHDGSLIFLVSNCSIVFTPATKCLVFHHSDEIDCFHQDCLVQLWMD